MPLAALLRRWARLCPQKAAVVWQNHRITYRQLSDMVDRLATGLLDLGVSKGDRVTAWLPNHPEFLAVYLASLRIGAAFVPLNIRYAEAEVESIIRQCEATILFVETMFGNINYLAVGLRLKDRLPFLRHLVVTRGEATPGTLSLEQLLHRTRPDQLDRCESVISGADLAVVVYTSGTTGQPKGAMGTHNTAEAYGRAAVEVGLFRHDDRVLILVPFSTAAGTLIQAIPVLTAGATLVLMDVFSAQESLSLIQREKVTCYVGPPTVYILQLDVATFHQYDLSSLQRLITGAAPVPPELAARICKSMPGRLINSYGATETGGLITYMPENAPQEKVIATCGIPIPGYEIRVVDNHCRPVAAGTVGEVAVRGPSIMAGYFRDEIQTREVLDEDGWLHLGDLGEIDFQGYLRLMGRKKDMYIRGGFNVYPAEVEAVLQRHPDILMCAVIGLPDPVLGERGWAVIVPKPGAHLETEAIRTFCHGQIADYKVPDGVVIRDGLPLTALGKVRKDHLTKEALHQRWHQQ